MGIQEDKLILLVGASGSGKTTIAKKLEQEGHNIIHSYTTREPRGPNEWGHIFIKGIWYEVDIFSGVHRMVKSEKEVPIEISKKEMIAYKSIYGESYFATKDQYQNKGTSIYVVDPEGAEMVKENVKDAEVVTISLMADEGIRFERLYDRASERAKGWQSLSNQVDRRIEADKEIFKTCKCDYVVDANREVDEVLKDILQIIEN